MSKKPYMYEHLEWLEIFQRKDWNDPTVNPDDLKEYSEFNRPYAQPDGEDSYPAWEMTWPTIGFPDIPPIIQPDPIGTPCSAEDSCRSAAIIGRDTLEPGEASIYTQVHVFVGCDVAPGWAAFGSWRLEGGNGDVALRFTPISATITVPASAEAQMVILVYEGPLECQATKEITIESGCCEDFTVTGDDTVAADDVWTGTVSPACPGATLEVVSTADPVCTIVSESINEAGSEVTVSTVDLCGSFVVTVKGEDDCYTAFKTVRVTSGTWTLCHFKDDHCTAAWPNVKCNDNFATRIRGGYTAQQYQGTSAGCPSAPDHMCSGDPLGAWPLAWDCGGNAWVAISKTWKWGCNTC